METSIGTDHKVARSQRERLARLGILEEPMGYVDGQNLYEYVRSGPVNGLDPSGLDRDPNPPYRPISNAAVTQLPLGQALSQAKQQNIPILRHVQNYITQFGYSINALGNLFVATGTDKDPNDPAGGAVFGYQVHCPANKRYVQLMVVTIRQFQGSTPISDELGVAALETAPDKYIDLHYDVAAKHYLKPGATRIAFTTEVTGGTGTVNQQGLTIPGGHDGALSVWRTTTEAEVSMLRKALSIEGAKYEWSWQTVVDFKAGTASYYRLS